MEAEDKVHYLDRTKTGEIAAKGCSETRPKVAGILR